MKIFALTILSLSALSLSAIAADSQPVQLIKDLGLSEYLCQYKISASAELPINISEGVTLYAVDSKTAYTVCLARIGAQVFGNAGELVVMANNTKSAPNKFVPVNEILLARIK